MTNNNIQTVRVADKRFTVLTPEAIQELLKKADRLSKLPKTITRTVELKSILRAIAQTAKTCEDIERYREAVHQSNEYFNLILKNAFESFFGEVR